MKLTIKLLALPILAVFLGTGLFASSGWYVEVSPTWLTGQSKASISVPVDYFPMTGEGIVSVTGYVVYIPNPVNNPPPNPNSLNATTTTTTNLAGATIGFGRQINDWNQVQIDVGYLTRTSVRTGGNYQYAYGYMERISELGGNYYYPINNSTDIHYDIAYSRKYPSNTFVSTKILPILASYNFTWKFIKNFTLKVGPTVGYSFGDGISGLSYGANLALKYNVSRKIYIQIGARYLNMKMSQTNVKLYGYTYTLPSSNTNTISGVLTVGWNL